MNEMLGIENATDISGLPRSSLHLKVSQGTFPSPVKLGKRYVGWLRHEVEFVNAARAAGRNDDDLKIIVKQLENKRVPSFAVLEKQLRESSAV